MRFFLLRRFLGNQPVSSSTPWCPRIRCADVLSSLDPLFLYYLIQVFTPVIPPTALGLRRPSLDSHPRHCTLHDTARRPSHPPPFTRSLTRTRPCRRSVAAGRGGRGRGAGGCFDPGAAPTLLPHGLPRSTRRAPRHATPQCCSRPGSRAGYELSWLVAGVAQAGSRADRGGRAGV